MTYGDTEKRERAIAGARMAIEDSSISYTEASETVGVCRSYVVEAALILRFGTPEENKAFAELTIPARRLADTIRQRTPQEHKRKTPAAPRRSAETIDMSVRIFRAARLCLADNVSNKDAARREGVSHKQVSDAVTVLKHGTPEQIAKGESGEMGLNPLINLIRSYIPADVRKAARKQNVRGQEAIEVFKTESAIFAKLRIALEAIASMPQPSDVVAVARKNNIRADTVNRFLMTSFSWITEFSDEWTK